MSCQEYSIGASAKFEIDFADVDDPEFLLFCRRFKIDPKKMPVLKFEGCVVDVDPDSLDDDQLAEEYESRRTAGAWLEVVYRHLAENDCESAMDELYRKFGSFGLAPPSHERRIVDMLTGYKERTHA